MITYSSGGLHFLLNVGKVKGSVFPMALLISVPVAALTTLVTMGIHVYGVLPSLIHENSVMKETAVLSSFNFLVGFLVVFRTSQAYSRFWEGCTSTHKMGAEWFDACSSIMAFCKYSEVEEGMIRNFQNTLIRLFSMLHAAALGEIEDAQTQTSQSRKSQHAVVAEVEAFHMELIDADSIDSESLLAVRDCDAKVELIFQWIQQLIVENIRTGVLSIPPPILSRAFQELANGMVHFHDAMKISNVPFPFPYAQTCDCILLLHWCLTPLVVSQWVINPWFAGMFGSMQVFALWTLNLIAVELENPFGVDPNDIDGWGMQSDMNNHLRLLIRKETLRIPSLESAPAATSSRGTGEMEIADYTERIISDNRQSSFLKVWANMDVETVCRRRRLQAGTTERDKVASNLHKSAEGPVEAMKKNLNTGASYSPDAGWIRSGQPTRSSSAETGPFRDDQAVDVKPSYKHYRGQGGCREATGDARNSGSYAEEGDSARLIGRGAPSPSSLGGTVGPSVNVNGSSMHGRFGPQNGPPQFQRECHALSANSTNAMATPSEAPAEVRKPRAKEDSGDVAGTSDIWLDTATQARLQEIFTDLEMWHGVSGTDAAGNTASPEIKTGAQAAAAAPSARAPPAS